VLGRFCETDLGRVRFSPEVPELQQHGERPLQLSVQVDLVASQPHEGVRRQGLLPCFGSDFLRPTGDTRQPASATAITKPSCSPALS